MTQVEFHTGVVDRVHFVCRLLRKACRLQAAVLVTSDAATLDALDRELWTFAPHEFVPHCRVDAATADSALARRSPVWLAERCPPAPHPKIVVNLGGAMPDAPGAFSRVIEILTADPDAARAGRARWRAYAALGLEVVHHPAGAAS
jgi:DNA polymerase-3 subunit chi